MTILADHQANRAASMGWAELTNGDLLAATEAAGFEVLVTADQGMRYQQNMDGRRIAIVTLSTNSWPVLRLGAALITQAVLSASPGSYRRLDFPRPLLRRRPLPSTTA